MGIIRFTIRGFRGIAELAAKPDGKSVTLSGRNGAGKSSAIDALWWGLGGNVDGEVVRNGSERAEVEIIFGDYLVSRKQSKGKRPMLTVKSADGKATFNSPTALLAGFVGAIERRTFSTKKPTERAEVLRRLAPGLDVSQLDADRSRVYDQRTEVNRDAKQLRAQAEGVAIPEAPAEIGEEKSIGDLLTRQRVMADQLTANNLARADVEKARRTVVTAEEEVAALHRQIEELQRRHAEARRHADNLAHMAEVAAGKVAGLVDPDFGAIKFEVANVEQHNRAVRAAQQQQADRRRAEADRDRLASAAAAKEAESKKLTERIDFIDTEKADRIARAACPISGLSLAGDAVLFDDGTHGPVEIEALNTGSRMRLDVEIAAALGHRLIAVRDASLLDADGRAQLAALAAAKGVQLLSEIVSAGERVTAEIEEGAVGEGVQLEAEF